MNRQISNNLKKKEFLNLLMRKRKKKKKEMNKHIKIP